MTAPGATVVSQMTPPQTGESGIVNGKRVESGLEVSAFRLARHHPAGKAPAKPSAICHDVCGFQAQVMSAAEIALWARNHELTRTEIHSALCESRDRNAWRRAHDPQGLD